MSATTPMANVADTQALARTLVVPRAASVDVEADAYVAERWYCRACGRIWTLVRR